MSRPRFRLMVTDGQPRKLDIDADNRVIGDGGFRLNPDGRRIAFIGEAGKPGYEIWALEKSLPAGCAKKQAPVLWTFGELQRAFLQPSDSRLVLIEAFGLSPNRVSEDPEVVSQAFGDDVTMPAGLFGRAGDFLAQSSDFGFVGLRPLEAIEPAVDVSFELGDGHGLT